MDGQTDAEGMDGKTDTHPQSGVEPFHMWKVERAPVFHQVANRGLNMLRLDKHLEFFFLTD